jgi:hypothetical protein
VETIKEKANYITEWTTGEELYFIDRLGKKGGNGNIPITSPHQIQNREMLLRGYLASLTTRVDWCRMDKGAVAIHALKAWEALNG